MTLLKTAKAFGKIHRQKKRESQGLLDSKHFRRR
jgi:hypothetical protein